MRWSVVLLVVDGNLGVCTGGPLKRRNLGLIFELVRVPRRVVMVGPQGWMGIWFLSSHMFWFWECTRGLVRHPRRLGFRNLRDRGWWIDLTVDSRLVFGPSIVESRC